MKRTACFAALLAVLVLAGCVLFPDAAETIALNWGIALPPGASVAYAADTGPSPHGDGLRCHVFCWEDPSAPADLLPWSEPDEARLALAEEIVKELGVPAEGLPDFSDCLSWYRRERENQIALFYDPRGGALWVLESLL